MKSQQEKIFEEYIIKKNIYIDSLEKTVDFEINTYSDLCDALSKRIAYFPQSETKKCRCKNTLC